MFVVRTVEDSKNSLIFLKLFPFVLTTFSLLGGFTKGLWELYNRRNSSQVSLDLLPVKSEPTSGLDSINFRSEIVIF